MFYLIYWPFFSLTIQICRPVPPPLFLLSLGKAEIMQKCRDWSRASHLTGHGLGLDNISPYGEKIKQA